jgi:hypothetical protein
MTTQSNGGGLWTEQAASGSGALLGEAVFVGADADEWTPATGVPAEAQLIDSVGDDHYRLYNVRDPWFFIDDGAGGYTLGDDEDDAVAVLVEDSAGGLVLTELDGDDVTVDDADAQLYEQGSADTDAPVDVIDDDAPRLVGASTSAGYTWF